MKISVTDFKQRCLEVVREAEATGRSVVITRRGRMVVQLEPAPGAIPASRGKPWERMRGRGQWLAASCETFVTKTDLKGL
jgi:prevent-host-death family protein